MPHKRNPILTERICGMARLLRGNLVPAIENIALWHERDISHSSVERVILPDGFIGLDYTLHLTARVLAGMDVDAGRMRANMDAAGGLFFSQRALLALTEAFGSREEAYALVQETAMRAWREKLSLQELLAADPRVRAELSAERLAEVFDLDSFFANLPPVFERVLATEWAR